MQGLTLRNARRLEEILVVLIRFGFGEWVRRLRPGGKAAAALRKGGQQKPARKTSKNGADSPGDDPGSADRWRRLRMALESLGPTFVKLGQLMSNRGDVLPTALVIELTKLQDQVPAFSLEQVDAIILAEFGTPRNELFPVFEATPVASASMAQVHEAYLADGRRVAVKVQRPGIESVIGRDIEVLAILAGLIDRYLADMRHFDPKGMVAEFSKQILRELDFSLELHNMERFAQLFKGNSYIHVPRAYKDFSSKRVLTMEFVQGTKLSHIIEDKNGSFDKAVIAQRLAELMLEQVFFHGFFHADPHPGNVMILPGNIACFLDFGMMGRIHPDEQKILIDLLVSMTTNNYRHITQNVLRLAGQDIHDVPGLELEIADLLDLYFDRPLGDIDFGEVFQRLVNLVQSYDMKVPSKFLLMAKALVIAEGIGSRLSPDFSFMTLFGPFARKMGLRQLRPDRLFRTIADRSEDYAEIARDLPLEVMEIIRAMRRGESSINFRLRGIEPLRQTIENVGTRLIFGFVLAATLISSSLIIRAEVPPLVNGVPVIGLIGFGIAGLMSIGFMITIVSRYFRKSRKGD